MLHFLNGNGEKNHVIQSLPSPQWHLRVLKVNDIAPQHLRGPTMVGRQEFRCQLFVDNQNCISPWKINDWNLKNTCLKKEKSSEPNLILGLNMLIFPGYTSRTERTTKENSHEKSIWTCEHCWFFLAQGATMVHWQNFHILWFTVYSQIISGWYHVKVGKILAVNIVSIVSII